MGKAKQRKHQTSRMRPTGLASVKESEQMVDETGEGPAGDGYVGSTVAALSDQLQSASVEERQCACSTLANLVGEKGAIPEILSAGLVRIVGPLMVDPSTDVRQAAVGALRNLSVDGGIDVCEEMVKQDVMTPLVALLAQYGNDWRPSKKDKVELDSRSYTFVQAVHLLWNLCEVSDTAVKIFNNQNVLSNLLPCLQPELYGCTIAIAVAQCVYTVSENNECVCSQLRHPDILQQIHTLLTTTHEDVNQLLLRMLAAGIVFNVSPGELSSAAAIVQVLAEVLQQDSKQQVAQIVAQIVETSAEKESAIISAKREDKTEEVPESDEAMELPEPVETKVKSESLLNLLTAQQLAIQMVANICCTNDEEEEGWEDAEENWSDTSSDENGTSAPMDVENLKMDADSSSEIQSALISAGVLAHVCSKISSVESSDAFISNSDGKRIWRSLEQLKITALLCLGNVMDSSLASTDEATQLLAVLDNNLAQTESENVALLEAVASALRATTQRVAQDKPELLGTWSLSKIEVLCGLATSCPDSASRIKILRVIATFGTVLAKNPSASAQQLQAIGNFLLGVCQTRPELHEIAEALDAVFDVFAEDDVDDIILAVNMIPTLTALIPSLKEKFQKQKRHLGDHRAIVSTARTNLTRFIQYKTQKLAMKKQ